METPVPASPAQGATVEGLPQPRIARSLLLAIAAGWFLIQALSEVDPDPAISIIPLVQRMGFGFALVAVALIDWSSLRGLLGRGLFGVE